MVPPPRPVPPPQRKHVYWDNEKNLDGEPDSDDDEGFIKKDARVVAPWIDGQWYSATIVHVGLQERARVAFEDGTIHTVQRSSCWRTTTPRRRGAAKSRDFTPAKLRTAARPPPPPPPPPRPTRPCAICMSTIDDSAHVLQCGHALGTQRASVRALITDPPLICDAPIAPCPAPSAEARIWCGRGRRLRRRARHRPASTPCPPPSRLINLLVSYRTLDLLSGHRESGGPAGRKIFAEAEQPQIIVHLERCGGARAASGRLLFAFLLLQSRGEMHSEGEQAVPVDADQAVPPVNAEQGAAGDSCAAVDRRSLWARFLRWADAQPSPSAAGSKRGSTR